MHYIPLLSSLLLGTLSAFAASHTESWIQLADNYTAQKSLPSDWEVKNGNVEPPAIPFEQLITALPDAAEWTELRNAYAEHVAAAGRTAPSESLMQIFLAYLNGDHDQIPTLMATLDQQLIGNKDSHRIDHPYERLQQALFDENPKADPDAVVDSFLERLKQYQPISKAQVIEIIGSEAVLNDIENMIEEQAKIMADYRASIRKDLTAEEAAKLFEDLQAAYAEQRAKSKDTIQAMGQHMKHPVVQEYLNKQGGRDRSYVPTETMPDLVTLVGEAKATQIIKEALTARVRFRLDNADATLRLTRKLALEQIDSLQAAQWDLINSTDSVALYEAMDARFPLVGELEQDYSRRSAMGYYFWGLVANNETEQAMQLLAEQTTLVERLPYGAINDLKRAGYTRQVWNFLHELLNQHPELDLWSQYISLSAEIGESEAMLATVEGSLSKESTDPELELKKRSKVISAYLSAGQIEKAVDWMQKAIEPISEISEAAEEQFEIATQLARVGMRMNQSEWTEMGLTAAKASLEFVEMVSQYGNASTYKQMELAGLYLQNDQVDQADVYLSETLERLNAAATAMIEANKSGNGQNNYRSNDMQSLAAFQKRNDSSYQKLLTAQLGIAHLAGKHDVVTALLERPEWMSEDIAQIQTTEDASQAEKKLGYLVAQHLHHQGETEAANRALESLILEASGYDPAYALYLEINGADAIPFFDTLYSVDQFEERPLIWKAQHLVNIGELDAAETIATQAISIDPSDGEQPRNDRMRVYDVMRQIRSAQGNDKEAKFFADVLKAIRVSENADLYWQAGLHLEALKRYRESLNYFQDAYCIQSRLAVRLYDDGKTEEAYAHYRKAYELMPSSFGRVESHCFGCESVFKGDKPQSIADEVFSSMLVSQAEVPQVHYLMGYLRDYQDREVEALKHYQDAVALDPEYLNAWKKISGLSDQMAMDVETKDNLRLKIYSLDPLGKHSSAQLNKVSDLKGMWQAVQNQLEALKALPQIESVFPLNAAQKVLAQLPPSDRRNSNQKISHPSDVLIKNPAIEAFEQMFVALSH